MDTLQELILIAVQTLVTLIHHSRTHTTFTLYPWPKPEALVLLMEEWRPWGSHTLRKYPST